jgi:dTDP-4-dehydrorhamnose reductase
MKILLIGKNGQVGWELKRTLATLGDLIALDYPEIDLADMDSVRRYIKEVKPTLIVNAAAYTNVDKAENEPGLAGLINGTAPGVMAEEARRIGAAFIHYSTDYVYDGTKNSAYVETDTPNPLNIYGTTKLHGDQAVEQVGGAYLILRTSWVYSLRQGGFVNKVLEWARKQEVLRIVDDQIGSPTWARMLAEVTAQVIAQGRGDSLAYLQEKAGLYHLAGTGAATRYNWAKAILELDPKKEQQVVTNFIPAKSRDFPTPAKRPSSTELNCFAFSKSTNLLIPNWYDSLSLMLVSTDR